MRRLVDWAEQEPHVRAVFLVGSRGEADAAPDALSDHDVLMVTRDRVAYESHDAWLTSFGPILVKLHDEYEMLGTTVATRLVQYRDGTRIDFSICDVELLERMIGQPRLPDVLDGGFRVLVDKDGWAPRVPEPTRAAYRGRLPDETVYRQAVDEFWWEVTYVAKHLARGEMLPALYSRECVIRFRCLVPMLEWYARAVRGSTVRIGPHGRGLMHALDEAELHRLEQTWSGRSVDEGWDALFAMTDYFREVSRAVAERLGFAPVDALADDVELLLRDIRSGGESSR